MEEIRSSLLVGGPVNAPGRTGDLNFWSRIPDDDVDYDDIDDADDDNDDDDVERRKKIATRETTSISPSSLCLSTSSPPRSSIPAAFPIASLILPRTSVHIEVCVMRILHVYPLLPLFPRNATTSSLYPIYPCF